GGVVAIGSRQRPDRHTKVSAYLPRVDTPLQQPGCARMAQNMRCHVRTEAGTLDGRPPCLRESPNLLAVEMDHKFRAVKLSPASQVAEDTPTKAHRRRALSRLLPLAVAPAPH